MMSSHDSFVASGNSPTQSRKIQPDFVVENHGSIFLLKPLTPSATSWIEEHIGQDNGYQPYFPIVVVEHRYIADIVAGIQNDGLAVQP
jgi:predicted Zn-dependent protease